MNSGFLDKFLYRLARKGEIAYVKLTGKDVTSPATLTILEKDEDEMILMAKGTSVPVDTLAGFAKGCLFIKTDAGAGNSGLYENVGTTASCNFDLVNTSSATKWNAIADADGAGSVSFATYRQDLTSAKTDDDMLVISGTGNFGDVSILRVEQKTGNPTDGTVVEIISADANCDALIVTANSANRISVSGAGVVDIVGGAGSITFTDFTVSADGVITVTPDDSPAACIVVDPSAAATTGIDCSEANLTNAMDCGANVITGTTASIDFTNFKVAADGDLTAVDGTFSGNLAVTGAFTIDAVVAKTAATTITVDGTGVGGVTIGGTSTGTITLGGGATLVNLPATVDLVLAGGDLTVTDTANADMVTFTNNTMTTADLLTLSAAGTRTSDNVIEITDGATTADTIGITANAQTSGNGIVYTNTGAALTGAVLRMNVTDGAGFTGYYIQCYDGAANDFAVRRYGAVTIGGLASTDMITITAGDIQLDAGDIDIDLGRITIDNTADEGNTIKRNNATGTAPVLEIEQTHATGGKALVIDQDNTTAAAYALEIESAGATEIHLSANGAAGDGILVDVTDAHTGQVFKIDAGPWLGTAGEGAALDFRSDSAATAEAGHAVYIKMQGSAADAAAIDGKGLYIEDEAGATAGSYLVKLDTANNTALHISNSGAGADGIKIDVANTYTGQVFVADLGPWTGTGGEGQFYMFSDSAATVPAGQFMKLMQQGTGQHAGAIDGSVLEIQDDATAPAAGTSYAVQITATNIEALHVDAGKVLVDETVTATGGLSSGSAADSLLFCDTVSITSAEVKALKAAPKTLIAQPGADYFIEVISAVFILDYGTNVFTEADDNLVIQYATSGDDITAAIEMTGFIDQAADTIMIVQPSHPLAANAAADMLNNAVNLYNPNDEIGGNAANDSVLDVKITYRIHKAGL